MTTKYTKKQIEDVARILSWHTTAAGVDEDRKRMEELGYLCGHFADLFATDNPKCCLYCGYIEGATEICDSADGQLRDEHTFEYGFNRVQFLTTCGLDVE